MKTGLLALLMLGAPLAHAHITLAPPSAAAGAYQTLTFKVGHGCDGSATTGITVAVPDGVLSAKPMPKPGWTIALAEAKLAVPGQLHGKPVTSAVREVTWRGGPLPDAWYDEFVLMVKLPDTPGRYVFKVGQVCERGRTDWADVATGDNPKPKSPAPVLDVVPAADAHAGHH
jgi:uncharacterized protein YcnI